MATYTLVAEPLRLRFFGAAGPHILAAAPLALTLTLPPVSLYSSQSGLVFHDAVAEWTTTSGNAGVYVLGGALPENNMFDALLSEGDECHASVRDSIRHERIKARFAKPNQLIRLEIDRSSSGGAAVDWPSTGRRIVRLETAPAALIRKIRTIADASRYLYSTPTSADTITLSTFTEEVLIDPASAIAVLAIVLPPNPGNLDTVRISTSKLISSLLVTAPGSETVNSDFFMMTPHGGVAWRYRAANTTWYRAY